MSVNCNVCTVTSCRILASCTELMQAIKVLVLASKDLQRDIVEGGRVSTRLFECCNTEQQQIGDFVESWLNFVSRLQGAATIKEFYAKNSRWTEGLISASKAVGWGATVMVYVDWDACIEFAGKFFTPARFLNVCLCVCRDAADLVVQGKGKFEELMVCSHEIAASTAQLVAASKVQADFCKSSCRQVDLKQW